MAKIYKQTKIAQDRLRQRANRKHWNDFRAGFGLLKLKSYGPKYSLTVAEAQAEAAALGIVPTAQALLAQAPIVQPAVVQPAVANPKSKSKPLKRKVIDFHSDDDIGDDWYPEIEAETGKRGKSKPYPIFATASGRNSKKARMDAQDEDIADNENEVRFSERDILDGIQGPYGNNDEDATTKGENDALLSLVKSKSDTKILKLAKGLFNDPRTRRLINGVFSDGLQMMFDAPEDDLLERLQNGYGLMGKEGASNIFNSNAGEQISDLQDQNYGGEVDEERLEYWQQVGDSQDQQQGKELGQDLPEYEVTGRMAKKSAITMALDRIDEATVVDADAERHNSFQETYEDIRYGAEEGLDPDDH